MRRSIFGVMAIAMLLVLGLVAPSLAESDDGVVYTGQGFDDGVLETEKCDPVDLGQGSWDPAWGDIEERGYLKWVFNQAPEDVVLSGPWGTVNMTPVGEKNNHAVTPYYPVDELIGVVSTDVDGGQLTVSNGCPGETEEPDPELQLTSICSATEDGTYLVYVSGEVGFEEMFVSAGDHVFRVTNIGSVETTYSYEGTEVATLAPGEWDFFTVPASQPGTTIITYGEGLQETKAQNAELCEAVEEPDTFTLIFNKSWTGDEFDDSDVVVTFTVTLDDDETFTLNDGEESDPIEEGTDWDVEENVTGFPSDVCSYISTVGSTIADQEDPSVLITGVNNDVDCEEPTEEPVIEEPTEEAPEEEPAEEAPAEEAPEETVTEEAEEEPVTEVTRTTPTRIDSGTGGLLPTTGGFGLLALMLAGMLLVGTGLSVLGRRR